MCRGPRAGVRGARERGSEGGLRGYPEWSTDTPEAQFRSEVRGSLPCLRVVSSPYRRADFRRSGRGLPRVREVRYFGDGFGGRFGDILERPAMVRWGASKWTVALGTRLTKLPNPLVHSEGPRWTVASAARGDHFGGHFGAHFRGHFGGHFGDMLE